MAEFEAYQEYQRIEDYEEDSPPGEEDLLIHVPEGLRGKVIIFVPVTDYMKSRRQHKLYLEVQGTYGCLHTKISEMVVL